MFNRLISYLERNDILHNYQFGFRKNHSTSLALIDVVDNIYQNLDASLTVVGIYLDLTKAFDTVKSYLCNRQQYTILLSIMCPLVLLVYYVCVEPQGSTLGPLLLLLFFGVCK